MESGASEKGYLFGGMDFIDHSHDSFMYDPNDDYNAWTERRSRREQELRDALEKQRTFGVEYDESPVRNFAYDENYRGYSANHPTKHWHYSGMFCLNFF